MPVPRHLVHSEWFDTALQRLGDLKDVEVSLAKELYRVACYADLIDVSRIQLSEKAPSTKHWL